MTSPKSADFKPAYGLRKKFGNSSSIPTLYYFDMNGLAEPIRFCFVYGNIDFVDVRIPFEKWPTHYKSIAPTGTAPWLEVDGEQFAESQAILQYAAKRSGLIPQTTEDYVTCMTVAEMVGSTRKKLLGKMREEIARANASVFDHNARSQAMHKLVTEGMIFDLVRPLEDAISKTQDNEGHIAGGELSFVDMLVATYVYGFCERAESHTTKIQQSLPHMYRTMELVYSQPAIQKWVMQHSHVPALYCKPESVEGRMVRIALSIAGIKYEFKGEADVPRINIQSEEVATGVRPCCIWVNARYQMMPMKSNLQVLGMWSLVELICGMASSWGNSSDADKVTVKQINQMIVRTQSREGFCIGHSMSLADVAAAAFYEYYMSGHSLGLAASDIEGYRNAHRVVYQIPAVAGDALKYDPVPTLVYFDFAGKGEAIRFLCHVAGIKFNDIRVSWTSWNNGEYKEQSPNGQLPYMQIGDITLSEQSGILTYVASKTDMMPMTAAGQYHTQVIESVSHQAMRVMGTAFRAPTIEEKTAAINESLPGYLTLMESLINRYKQPNSLPQYLVEDRLTWIDFLIAGIMANLPEALGYDFSQWTSMKAIYDNIVTLPEVVKYKEQRGPVGTVLSELKKVEEAAAQKEAAQKEVAQDDEVVQENVVQEEAPKSSN